MLNGYISSVVKLNVLKVYTVVILPCYDFFLLKIKVERREAVNFKYCVIVRILVQRSFITCTHKRVRAHTRARAHTRTHTHVHTHIHARTHTRTLADMLFLVTLTD